MIRDSIATIGRTGYQGQIVVRADSAYYNHAIVNAITRTGATYSITVRQDPAIRRHITEIDPAGWKRITYTQAIPDPDTGELVSAAEVAEIDYTAFTSKAKAKQVTARLIVRRVPELNKTKLEAAGQQGLFPVYRYHALITNHTGELIDVEKAHRGHAIIESVIADLKSSALAPPAIQGDQRERRLAGRRHDRVQPHPSHRCPHRRRVHQSRGSDRASPDHQHPRPHRHQRPQTHPAPTRPLALDHRMDPHLERRHDHLNKGT